MKELNKKAIGVACVALVIVMIIFVFTLKKSSASKETEALRNQNVKGISFENVEITKEDEDNIFSVDLYNENNKKVEIKKLVFIFKNDKKDIKVELNDVESLESLEGRKITIKVKEDITNCNDIEYKVINK